MNCCKPCVLVLVALIGLSDYSKADLLAYYRFEAGEGTSVTDFSFNGFHGRASNTFTFSADGLSGGAGDFGDFNNGAVVLFPDEFSAADHGFNRIVESQELTVSLWLNREGKPANDAWTFLFGESRQFGSHAPWSDGMVYFDVAGCCGDSQRIAASMGNAVADGEWHHLAFIKKASERESDKSITAIFRDGVPIVSSPGCDLACWSSGAENVKWEAATIDDVAAIDVASIGADFAGGSSHAGLIDEFAIWDEALPLTRLKSLAAGAPAIHVHHDPLGDFNADGSLTMADYHIMTANFGQRFHWKLPTKEETSAVT